MSQPKTAQPKTAQRPIPAMLVALILGLVFGLAVFEFVNAGIALIWETIPHQWGSIPAWYLLGAVIAAALLVYLIRRHIADPLHAALDGFSVHPMTGRQYLGAILAILASLWGGIVLGPEVALVSTGSLIGTLTTRWFNVADAAQARKVISVGALGAILALFVGPVLSGSATLDRRPPVVEFDQWLWAVAVALIVGVAVTLARVVAALFARIAGQRPHLPVLLTSAVIIGLAGITMEAVTGETPLFVVTSGEELMVELPKLTSVSTVVALIVLKTIAYAASLGSGFRGGPFFPGMFIGAATGLLASLVLPSGPSVIAGIVVGVVAAVIATAPMKWRTAIILGAVIGFIMGGWAVVPPAIIGAIVARTVPRWGDRVTKSPSGEAVQAAQHA